MRRNIVHPGAGSLTYAIREIVEVAHRFHAEGLPITWENIGDPIEKGEQVPAWIREIVLRLTEQNAAWGYCATAGVLETREFLVDRIRRRGGAHLGVDDIIFYNGLGDAVARVYGQLRREARILGPSPAYSTHSSAEAAHSGFEHLTYTLDPRNSWLPDLDEIRCQVKYNDSIAGIALINPDNPTGAVYPRAVLEGLVEIARGHDLFLICDEIYTHITYDRPSALHLSEVLGDVCALVMRGISKEYPWPGSRCGWVEAYNRGRDPIFDQYVKSLLAAKRLEVCSTTIPQLSIPQVMRDERYPAHLDARAAAFAGRAAEAQTALSGIPGILAVPPQGAFYYTVVFEEGALNDQQSLPVEKPKIRALLEPLVAKAARDARFVYYLLASTGICVVPLSGFCCARDGFRFTLLECDPAKRARTFQTLADSVKAYLASA